MNSSSTVPLKNNRSPKPTVSVLMTTFAHENTIIQAIEGVVMQQCDFEVELIIANDCSPDRTDFKIREYLANTIIPENIAVRYTNHESNLGMMPNIIWALKQVRGKYIAVCEGDDYWIDALKLQKQVDFLEANSDFGLVHTNYKIFHAKTQQLVLHKPQESVSRSNENDYYLQTGDIRTCTVLFRTSFLPHFKQLIEQDFMKDPVIGDRPFFLLISTISRIHFIKDVTSVYYITAHTSASHFADFFKYYDFLKKVSITNIELLKFLKIENPEYVNKQKRKIGFYNVLLSFKNKNYLHSVKMLFSKTGRHFWNKKELLEIYGMIRKL